MAKKGSRDRTPSDRTVVATNRRARRDYDILDTVEAGLVLRGSEVKSLRDRNVQMADSYARIEDGEMWVHGLHISPWSHSSAFTGHDPDRPRKLLLHRSQIDRLGARVDQERLTLVPLSIYFRQGRAKMELALARGRRSYDKRQVIARRDADREAERAMARHRRR